MVPPRSLAVSIVLLRTLYFSYSFQRLGHFKNGVSKQKPQVVTASPNPAELITESTASPGSTSIVILNYIPWRVRVADLCGEEFPDASMDDPSISFRYNP